VEQLFFAWVILITLDEHNAIRPSQCRRQFPHAKLLLDLDHSTLPCFRLLFCHAATRMAGTAI